MGLDLKTLSLPEGYEAKKEELGVSNGVDNQWIVLYRHGKSFRIFSPSHTGPFGEEQFLDKLKWMIESAAWSAEKEEEVGDEEKE